MFSRSLQRQISSLTSLALVQPGQRSAPVLTSAGHLGDACPDSAAAALRRQLQPGRAQGLRPRRAGGTAARALAARLAAAPAPEHMRQLAQELAAGDGWALFSCRFEDGSEDLIALRLEGGPHDAHCGDILQAIWPVLREDALRELAGETQAAVTSALLWTVSKKTDSAVLVLSAEGALLHCNESGRDMLDGGDLLSDSSGRLCCASPGETAGFYAAVAECARSRRGGSGRPRELILFLEGRQSGMRLPVSLTRYRCAGSDQPLVVAILPRQPDRTRIEMLAQKMGLSPSEARVAALIQLGLTNREAAHIAGLKEQTFNTYAKRVLAKLQSAGRAEMAQRLTWQASLGRAS
ncbi:helix-turn-helix transcriptional regulator [Leisingera sp. ANG-Vp]|uniref:helix-turn-helix transcriptional regulator n=1 Tax=Leisingera sp. ANG-Vp TaxID=1577896 RepID=UPI001F4C9CBC|nr:helix-turn-helix transcriptional regulator [Leisingera sp. ANG-Vp]